jgi:hypothetical protein
MLPDRQRLPRMRTCVEHLVEVFHQPKADG